MTLKFNIKNVYDLEPAIGNKKAKKKSLIKVKDFLFINDKTNLVYSFLSYSILYTFS